MSHRERAIIEALLTLSQVSREYGVPEPTLRTWRAKGVGPKCARLNGNGRLMYRRSDVEAWLGAQFGRSA
jgi:DNA-binding transcriptional MerR regulator